MLINTKIILLNIIKTIIYIIVDFFKNFFYNMKLLILGNLIIIKSQYIVCYKL